MKTNQKLHQIQLNEWAVRIANQRSSGLSVKEWCDQNNYSIHSYNYWKHLLKEELASQVLPDIVPLSLPSSIPPATPESISTTTSLANRANCTIRANDICSIKMSINNICIEIDSSVPDEFLNKLIKAVCHA